MRYYGRYIPYAQAAGVVVTNDNALELSVVWGCVTAITSAISSCVWNVYTLNEKGQRKNLLNDPLYYLLNTRPNQDMTALSLREALLFGALIWGNGYAEIVRSRTGKITALWPLLPHRVMPRRDPPVYDEDGELTKAPALYYEVTEQGGGITRLEAEQMFHIRGPGITGLMGDNPIARASMSMSLAAAQERFASTYFGNNTEIGGVIEFPGKMSDEAHKNLKTSWEDVHKGPDKAHKVAILEGGAKWVAGKTSASDAQLTDSRKFQIEEICRWFACPPHKIQHLDRATFNNIEHLAIEFVRDTLTPWAMRLEQEANFKLLPTRGLSRATKLDMGWLTHGDFKSRMEGYQIARQTGVYSINDVLHREGENTIGALGDTRMVMANMQTLQQLEDGAHVPNPGGAPGSGDKGGNQPAEDGEETGTSDAGASGDQAGGADGVGGGPANVAHEAMVLLFASTFERYTSRLCNREADLRRGGATAAKVSSHLAEERVKLRPWLLEQSAEACALLKIPESEFLLAVDAIDNGTEPRFAAEQIVIQRKKAA